jgi:cysteinyl-tRNA synthetase
MDAALCNSFDTPAAMNVIRSLINDFNIWAKTTGADDPVLVTAMKPVAEWVTEIVNIFGLERNPVPGKIGWDNGLDEEKVAQLRPILRIIRDFRQQLRAIAKTGGDIAAVCEYPTTELATLGVTLGQNTPGHTAVYIGLDKEKFDGPAIYLVEPYVQLLSDLRGKALVASQTEILPLCDSIRDNDLLTLNVAIEDRDPKVALIKFAPAAKLIKGRDERAAKLEELAAKKQRTKAELDDKKKKEEEEKAEKAKIDPAEMFKPPHTSEWSAWDANGLPTKDAKGEDVTKSKGKTLLKFQTNQKKLHDKWMAMEASKLKI